MKRRIDHAYLTAKFYEKMGYKQPVVTGDVGEWIGLDDTAVEQVLTMLREEMSEIESSVENDHVEELVDGLADLIFVAMGALWHMGLDPDKVITEVCQSNLTKVPGESDRLNKDAIKGSGYVHPGWVTGTPLSEFSGHPVRLSPALVEASEIRSTKGRDYMSGGVKREDLNPFGLMSYAHNVIHKVARLRSLVISNHDPGHESLRDNCVDAINYLSFMIEYLDNEVVDY